MEKIIVNVAWCDKNFGGSLGSNVPGAVVFTAPTFEALKKECKESLEFHVEGLIENGEEVPEWLKNGDYEFVYNYQDATTLLKRIRFTISYVWIILAKRMLDEFYQASVL